jgi:O-antigen ligase
LKVTLKKGLDIKEAVALSTYVVSVSLLFSALINGIAIAIFFVTWVGYLVSYKGTITPKIGLFHAFSLIFFLLYFISLLYSDDRTTGIISMEKKLAILIFPIVFMTVHLSRLEFNNIIKYFSISTVVAAIICLVFLIFNLHLELEFSFESILQVFLPQNFRITTSPIGIHPAYFAFYCCIASIFLMKSAILNQQKKPLKYLSITVLLVLIFIIGYKIIILTTILSLLLLAGFYRKEVANNDYLFITFIILSIGVFIVVRSYAASVVEYPSESIQDNRWGKEDLRFEQWSAALELVASNKFFGLGIGDIQNELNQIYEENNLGSASKQHYNLHNQFLEILVELGIVGLSVFLLILLINISISIRNSDVMFLLFNFNFIFFCLAESVLERQKGIVLFFFICSAYHSIFTFSEPKKRKKLFYEI